MRTAHWTHIPPLSFNNCHLAVSLLACLPPQSHFRWFWKEIVPDSKLSFLRSDSSCNGVSGYLGHATKCVHTRAQGAVHIRQALYPWAGLTNLGCFLLCLEPKSGDKLGVGMKNPPLTFLSLNCLHWNLVCLSMDLLPWCGLYQLYPFVPSHFFFVLNFLWNDWFLAWRMYPDTLIA